MNPKRFNLGTAKKPNLFSMDIQFTFINQSSDSPFNVAICQKNLADGSFVAWQIIENSAPGDTSDFNYPVTSCIAAEDAWGNLTDLVETTLGQQWEVSLAPGGDDLLLEAQPADSPNVIEVKNCFLSGYLDAGLYKDGKLLAVKMGLAPQQKAVFALDTHLWLGIVPPDVEEGDLLDPALLTCMVSFLGIQKARIVVTGGGNEPVVFFMNPVQE